MSATPTAAPLGTSLVLDAEALYRELLRGVRSLMGPNTQLAGITSGGAWLVERLHQDLGLTQPISVLSSALHRDDFSQRGMSAAHKRSCTLMSTAPMCWCWTTCCTPAAPCAP